MFLPQNKESAVVTAKHISVCVSLTKCSAQDNQRYLQLLLIDSDLNWQKGSKVAEIINSHGPLTHKM